MTFSVFDQRPLLVAIAGPNGAGKTTFFHAHLQHGGLPFVNADVLAREMGLDPYAAADVADAVRRQWVERGQSFVFETVFSDPVGDKIGFLKQAAAAGYTVVLCYIGLSTPEICEQRIAMRVSQGGHGVPLDKVHTRFPRTLANLRTAIRELPHVLIYDNDDLSKPYRLAACFEHATLMSRSVDLPNWLQTMLD